MSLDNYFKRTRNTFNHLLTTYPNSDDHNSLISFYRHIYETLSKNKFKYVVFFFSTDIINSNENIFTIPILMSANNNVLCAKTLLIIPLLDELGSYPTFLIKGTEFYNKYVRSTDKLVVPNIETVMSKIYEYEQLIDLK